MIEQERFKLVSGIKLGTHSGIWDSRKQYNQGIGDELWLGEVVDLLNKLHEENEGLKHHLSELQGQNEILNKENAMLKNTIARNEAHIERMEHKGEWRK